MTNIARKMQFMASCIVVLGMGCVPSSHFTIGVVSPTKITYIDMYAEKNNSNKVLDIILYNKGNKDICVNENEWPSHGLMDDCVADRRLGVFSRGSVIPYKLRRCSDCMSGSGSSCLLRVGPGKKLKGYLNYSDFKEDLTDIPEESMSLEFPYVVSECD